MNICDSFVDNKIHFGKEKTKSIFFSTKIIKKNVVILGLNNGDIKIEQYSKLT